MNKTKMMNIRITGTVEDIAALLKIAHEPQEGVDGDDRLILRVGDFTCCGLTVMSIKQNYVRKNHRLLAKVEGKIPLYFPERLLGKKELINLLRSSPKVRVLTSLPAKAREIRPLQIESLLVASRREDHYLSASLPSLPRAQPIGPILLSPGNQEIVDTC